MTLASLAVPNWLRCCAKAGTPGARGSFRFADPDARLGYAYVMNKMDFYLNDDPREKALRDAIYRALRTAAPAPQYGLNSDFRLARTALWPGQH